MAKLAISSIAWHREEEPAVAEIIRGSGLKYVELVPTKIWPKDIQRDPSSVTNEQILEVKKFWEALDIQPVAMQSMLYLRPDLTIFDNVRIRQETKLYLEKFIELSGRMGISVMVFGSPKNRRRNGMALDKADDIASELFSSLGTKARECNVTLCIEPNPPGYGCDYVTTASEGAALVRLVDNPGFRLHLDAAGMALVGDDPSLSIAPNIDILGHFHISAPELGPISKEGQVNHEVIAKTLKTADYRNFLSVEMKPGEIGQNARRVGEAIILALSVYQ